LRRILRGVIYTVHKTSAALDLNWENPAWLAADTLEVTNFRPESSAHRAKTHARLLYDRQGIHGLFRVQDRFVRCMRTGYGSEVWKDACVEYFVEPRPGRGYFNFEFNCGGAFLCNHIVDPTRVPGGFKQFVRVPAEVARAVVVQTSMPPTTEPELADPITWAVQFFIPFEMLEKFVGPLGQVGGQVWRGNFFKCAEDNSHPHWAAWSPVDEFNFHLPRCFGEIRFD
jgi:hypothetical protein